MFVYRQGIAGVRNLKKNTNFMGGSTSSTVNTASFFKVGERIEQKNERKIYLNTSLNISVNTGSLYLSSSKALTTLLPNKKNVRTRYSNSKKNIIYGPIVVVTDDLKKAGMCKTDLEKKEGEKKSKCRLSQAPVQSSRI